MFNIRLLVNEYSIKKGITFKRALELWNAHESNIKNYVNRRIKG